MTTLIKNGTIITATDTYKADILVKNGIVSEIGREISKIASEIIDAGEKWILPGGVDVHTHLDASYDGMTTVDDFETATAAAAAGGTTTVVDYADQAPGGTLAATLEQWKAKAAPRAVIDYGFHVALSEVNEGTLGELPALVEAGVTSFKVSLDGAGVERVGDDALLELLQRAGAAGALPVVHPANGEVSALLRRRLAAEAKLAPRFIPASAPPELEGEAAGRVLALAELARTPVYLANVSSAHAVERVKAARDRGQAVYAETSPHYLVLSSDRYEDPEGMKFHASPPLRPSWHQEVLWRAVTSGDLHAIASDHTALNYAGQKDLGRENFTLGPRGMPGIQERLSVLHSAGVQPGRISANRFVEVASTLPAKLFGLFPRKGTLAVGSDADMVIFDPRAELTLSKAVALSRVDYTPFEGIRARGAAWLVIQRGRVIAREGRVMGRPGAGEFLARARFAGV
jgi:dihydropyrimidinase